MFASSWDRAAVAATARSLASISSSSMFLAIIPPIYIKTKPSTKIFPIIINTGRNKLKYGIPAEISIFRENCIGCRTGSGFNDISYIQPCGVIIFFSSLNNGTPAQPTRKNVPSLCDACSLEVMDSLTPGTSIATINAPCGVL